jgi:hypothetical protein
LHGLGAQGGLFAAKNKAAATAIVRHKSPDMLFAGLPLAGGARLGQGQQQGNAGVFTATGMTGKTTSVGVPANVAPNARAAVMMGMT